MGRIVVSTLPLAQPSDRQQLLARLTALLVERTGLALSERQWNDLERAATGAAVELDFADWRLYVSSLLEKSQTEVGASDLLQRLIDHLTIGETYFYRDKGVFLGLREFLLPPIIAARRPVHKYLRVWSAACSSGEEAYSIAIELARAIPDIAQWRVCVLATDINERFLTKASRGIYDRWSFRDSAPEQREPYIKCNAAGRYEVAPAIKQLVRFARLNLTENTYPALQNNTAAVDIIFCRNVLMYLRPEKAAAVLRRLADALVDGGWLIVSNVEAALVDVPTLTAVHLPEAIFFRKDDSKIRKDDWSEIDGMKKADSFSGRARALKLEFTNFVAVEPAPAVQQTVDAAGARSDTSVFVESRVRTDDPAHAFARQSAAVADTGSAEVLLQQAKAAADCGEFAAALTHCAQSLAIDKLNPAAHYLQASILLETGDANAQESDVKAAAELALRRTLYLDSGWIMAHVALGNLLMTQPARRAEARRQFAIARTLLRAAPPQQPVPAAEGLTAQQLLKMIATEENSETSR